MSSFDDLSERETPRYEDSPSREQLSAFSPSPRPSTSSILTGAERDDLRQRVVDARVRTKELIGVYLASSGRLTAALARHREAEVAREDARAALSATVARYAVLLRALGEPPERTLVLIKSAFREATPHQNEDSRAALEDVVKWIVEAYYAT